MRRKTRIYERLSGLGKIFYNTIYYAGKTLSFANKHKTALGSLVSLSIIFKVAAQPIRKPSSNDGLNVETVDPIYNYKCPQLLYFNPGRPNNLPESPHCYDSNHTLFSRLTKDSQSWSSLSKYVNKNNIKISLEEYHYLSWIMKAKNAAKIAKELCGRCQEAAEHSIIETIKAQFKPNVETTSIQELTITNSQNLDGEFNHVFVVYGADLIKARSLKIKDLQSFMQQLERQGEHVKICDSWDRFYNGKPMAWYKHFLTNTKFGAQAKAYDKIEVDDYTIPRKIKNNKTLLQLLNNIVNDRPLDYQEQEQEQETCQNSL